MLQLNILEPPIQHLYLVLHLLPFLLLSLPGKQQPSSILSLLQHWLIFDLDLFYVGNDMMLAKLKKWGEISCRAHGETVGATECHIDCTYNSTS